MSIRPLSEEVKAQIKSSVQITSLADAVEGLVTNALDSDAAKVTISIDFAKGFCAVEDDGSGIPSAEFLNDGRLAQLHCTSRYNIESSYGRNGQFLFCLSALSILSITSRRQNDSHASSLVLHRSKIVSRRFDSEEDEPAFGTTVKVYNLFGDVPVRFKQQALKCADPHEVERQFESIKTRLTAFLLAYPRPVMLRLSTSDHRNRWIYRPSSHTETFGLGKVGNVLRQASLQSTVGLAEWRLASIQASNISIRAAISTIPAPSKNCQFVSIGQHPVPCRGVGEFIYKQINRAFELSQFGSIEAGTNSTSATPLTKFTAERLPGYHHLKLVKGVDRWPCFYLRIDCEHKFDDFEHSIGHLSDPDRGAHNDTIPTSMHEILNIITTLIEHFLQKHHFRPRKRRDRRQCGNVTMPKPNIPKGTSFVGWRRTKLKGSLEEAELLHGLPFIGKPAEANSQHHLEDDFEILLNEIELSDSSNEPQLAARSPSCTESDAKAGSSCESIVWKDPRTKRLVHLNPDNGFVIPLSVDQQPAGTNREACRTVERRSSQPQSTRAAAPSALVERLKELPTSTFASKSEPQVRSVTIEEAEISPKSLTFGEESINAKWLADAQVIKQIDSKFILAKVPDCSGSGGHRTGSHLILVDQHAADERVKVEELYRELCQVNSTALTRPVTFEIDPLELQRFNQFRPYLETWAIRYDIGAISSTQLTVTHLPQLIAERMHLEPKLLIELLRREIWSDRPRPQAKPSESWPSRISSCPVGLLDLIKSRACRSAIMFNDKLTIAQCTTLIQRLSTCVLPFQCAHGRPSMTVLTNVQNLNIGVDWSTSDEEKPSFGNAFRGWTR